MKKLILALSIMTSTLGVFAHDDVVPSAISTDPNASNMTFEKDAIDYGTIKQDADGNRVFTFTNTGKSPLIISEAHGSCGCTVPTYPKEPIMPGQKAEIKVHYDTHRVGPFSKSVTVNSNSKNSPVVLRISGTVEAAVVENANTSPATIIPAPAVTPVKTTTPAATKTTTKATVKTTTKAPTKTTKAPTKTKTTTK
ncbi:MAG TPA: DUF1573 domain-containing protein [Chitinophagales bacterium]|jgi:hypothetical protein|nr:DUF1573 domain-containing protein [Chitinophagales bacterium]MBP6154321.1 DUF1573 domain-containing protein [Chitinophagales bacterium]HQV79101.1 DUF1573 domain-containing protein [Chitinophagales bacterium]HQW79775.1 DUF1573 domain-containing protein [Chitinophagales bacterium]HRB18669.1 DUF1573 domain-containing protein [Chitinophagales bacterium]